MVVGSGKGGTGKTFLAANLAVQWSLWGQRVILVDADLGLANLHIVLGIDPQAHLMGLLNGRRSRNGRGRELLVPGPAGVQLLPGGSGIERLASLNRGELRRLVQRLEPCLDDCDVVVVDLSSGISASCFSRSCMGVVYGSAKKIMPRQVSRSLSASGKPEK